MIVEVKTEKRIIRTIVLNEEEAVYLAQLTETCLLGRADTETQKERDIRTALNASACRTLEGITNYWNK